MKTSTIRIFAAVLLICLEAGSVRAQQKITREAYIDRYKNLALEQMDIYGIPASIKLAQALFESDDGNSRLAREANNHFGIKCKSDWKGETIAHDDDAKGECFRKYPSVEDSYKDHSEFLDKSPRYQALFKLDPLDYKGWARGLKQAGYATNPLYAEHLIRIIEENQLYLLDEGKELPAGNIMPRPGDITADADPEPAPQTTPATSGKVDIDNYTVSLHGGNGRHSVYSNNGSQFVVAEEGDSFASIASEFGLSVKKLLAFNDLLPGAQLSKGDMVYIRKKNKRSQNGKLIHMAKDGETMHGISQTYGIRLKNLCGINRRSKDSEVKAGQQIRLM